MQLNICRTIYAAQIILKVILLLFITYNSLVARPDVIESVPATACNIIITDIDHKILFKHL